MTDNRGTSEDLNRAVQEKVGRLLSELIAIPSYGAQEEAIVGYLVRRFQAQGIPCRVTELDGKPLNVVAEIADGLRDVLGPRRKT